MSSLAGLYHGSLGGPGKRRETFKKQAKIKITVTYEVNAESHSEAGAERELSKMIAAIKKGAELTGLNYPTCSAFSKYWDPSTYVLTDITFN